METVPADSVQRDPPPAAPLQEEVKKEDSERVWLKVKGFPWWPGVVASLSDVPESQRASVEASKHGDEHKLIFSFGERLFFWVTPSKATLRPFHDPDAYAEFSSKGKGAAFKVAFDECWAEKESPGSQLAALHVAEAEKAAKEKGQDEKQVAKRRKVEEEGGQEADDEGAEVSGEAKTKTKRKGPGAGAYRKTQEEEEEEIANFEEELRNHDYCDTCGDTGGLVCCDGCPGAFHVDCLGFEAADELPEPWFCHACEALRLHGKWTPFETAAATDVLGPAIAALSFAKIQWKRDAKWPTDVAVESSEEEDEEEELEIECGGDEEEENLDMVVEGEEASSEESEDSGSDSSGLDGDLRMSHLLKPASRKKTEEEKEEEDAQAAYLREMECLKASSVVCVCDLRTDAVDASELMAVFGKHGNLLFTPDIRPSSHCAYLSYSEPRGAQRAINSEQGTVLAGKTIFVKKVLEVPVRDESKDGPASAVAAPRRAASIFSLDISVRGHVEALLRGLPKMVWDAARENQERKDAVTRSFLQECLDLDGLLRRAQTRLQESLEPLLNEYLGEQRDVIKTRVKQQQQQLRAEYEQEKRAISERNLVEMQAILSQTQRVMHQMNVPYFWPSNNHGEIEVQEVILELIVQCPDPYGGWGGPDAYGGGQVGYNDYRHDGSGGGDGGEWQQQKQQQQQGWDQQQHYASGGEHSWHGGHDEGGHVREEVPSAPIVEEVTIPKKTSPAKPSKFTWGKQAPAKAPAPAPVADDEAQRPSQGKLQVHGHGGGTPTEANLKVGDLPPPAESEEGWGGAGCGGVAEAEGVEDDVVKDVEEMLAELDGML